MGVVPAGASSPSSLNGHWQRLQSQVGQVAEQLTPTDAGGPPDLPAAAVRVQQLRLTLRATALVMQTVDDLAAELLTRPRR